MNMAGYKVDKALSKQMENVTPHSFPSHMGVCSVDMETVAMMTRMEAMHGLNYMIFLHQDWSGYYHCWVSNLWMTGANDEIYTAYFAEFQQASPDSLVGLGSSHHGESNGLEYVSTEIETFLTAHCVSASISIHKRMESCIHCHSISHITSTYQRTFFIVKGLEQLAHSNKCTSATTCFINQKPVVWENCERGSCSLSYGTILKK